MYGPWVERESTEISTPPLNMKPSVVVPFENFKVCAWSSYRGAKCWWQNDAGCEVVGGCEVWWRGDVSERLVEKVCETAQRTHVGDVRKHECVRRDNPRLGRLLQLLNLCIKRLQ